MIFSWIVLSGFILGLLKGLSLTPEDAFRFLQYSFLLKWDILRILTTVYEACCCNCKDDLDSLVCHVDALIGLLFVWGAFQDQNHLWIQKMIQVSIWSWKDLWFHFYRLLIWKKNFGKRLNLKSLAPVSFNFWSFLCRPVWNLFPWEFLVIQPSS